MAEINFAFDRQKAIEVVLYIAQRIVDPTYHSISKLMYFADKTSLEKYGRFISGDWYTAMKLGPVPSNTYDLMKDSVPEFGFAVEAERCIVPLRDADVDELSDSDIECLDVAIAMYGDKPMWKRTEDSHDPAWQVAWQSRGNSESYPMSIESIVELFDDGGELLEHLSSDSSNG